MKKLLLLLLFAIPVHAQSWTPILPAGGIDWTIPGIPGGIPNETQSGSTIAATSGDRTATIQAALNSCGGTLLGPKFVLLGAGTFIIASHVTIPSFCRLAGGGADTTVLNCTSTAGTGCVVIGLAINNAPSAANDTPISGGITAGSTSFTVGSAAHISIGTLLMLSELNNLAAGVNNTGSEGPCTFCDFPHTHTRDAGQIVLVTNVTGTTVNFTPPLYHTYGAVLASWTATTNYFEYTFIVNGGHTYEQTANPGSPYNCVSGGSVPAFSTSGGSVSDGTCTWLDKGAGTTTAPVATPFQPASVLAGIENLQIFITNAGTSTLVGPSAVITQAQYPIVHGVAFNYTDADWIYAWYEYGGIIDENYFSNAILHTPGTYDSTLQLAGKSSAVLVQNNILERGHTGILLEDGASGNVISYNYALAGFDSGSPSVVIGGFDHHGAHTAFNLLEGNVWIQTYFDSVWGTSSFYTNFRNWVQGSSALDNPSTSGRQTVTGGATVTCSALSTNTTCFPFQASRAFQVSYLSTSDNFVGNVVGSAQQSSNIGYGSGVTPYNSGAAPQTDALRWSTSRSFDTTVYGYSFGYGESADSGSWPLDSTAAFSTAFLHGNYGNISNAIVWSGSVTQTLPASFYLASKPSWWGSLAYPAIGPDVTGAPGPGGHANLIPSQNCYLNVMHGVNGAGSPLTFNAANCYAGVAPPPPPIPNPVTIIGAANVQVPAGGSQQLVASCQTSPCGTVAYSTTAGTVNSSGLFIAPTVAQAVTVSATSGGATVSIPLTVVPVSTVIAGSGTCQYRESFSVPQTRTITVSGCNGSTCNCK